MNNHKKLWVLLAMSAFVILGIAAGMPGRPVHENLKVLPKDISKADLDEVMHGYKKALGVDCSFCHVKSKKDPNEWDYPSDEKPEKEITRKMMKLTEKVNLDFFEYKMTYKPDELLAVSCNTCHHGFARPDMVEVKKD
jgi:hypothetical protein